MRVISETGGVHRVRSIRVRGKVRRAQAPAAVQESRHRLGLAIYYSDGVRFARCTAAGWLGVNRASVVRAPIHRIAVVANEP